MNHYSASRVGMYLRCPQQYEFRYIEGKIIKPGVALIIGGSMAETCETNFGQKMETKIDLPIDNIKDHAGMVFDRKVDVDGLFVSKGESEKKVAGKGKDQTIALAEVYAKDLAPFVQPVAVEKEIRFPLWTDYEMLGYIDYMPNKHTVKDMKTFAKSKPQAELDSDIQLTTYSLAIEREIGFAPDLGFDVLLKKKKPEYLPQSSRRRTTQDYDILLELIWNIHQNIEKGSFPPTGRLNWVCSAKWCGYHKICKFWSGKL